MEKRSKRMLLLLRIVPMLLVMGTIFFVSHQPGSSLHLSHLPGIDKICHLAVYGLLALTVLWWLSPGKNQGGRTHLVSVALKTLLFCLVYGLTDEFHQSFIPGRSVSVFDLLADTGGAVVVVSIWLQNSRFRKYLALRQMALARRLLGAYTEDKFKKESCR
jgi:VanZ family protein